MTNRLTTLVAQSNDSFVMELRQTANGALLFWRKSKRSGIVNTIGQYTYLGSDGQAQILPLTEEIGRQVIARVMQGEHFASCFLFHAPGTQVPESLLATLRTKSDMEEKFTSTGAKFWHHRESMLSYREGTGNSVISTHISAEGRCNLACPYCSVTYRKTTNRLSMPVIKKYVQDLKTRGLKAAILTGGGEPTLYPQINELLEFLLSEGITPALITNGTNFNRVRPDLLHQLTWVRVSINIFEGWQERIRIPEGLSDHVTLGMSFVYTPQHQKSQFDLIDVLQQIKGMADRAGAEYVRLLPNCLLDQESLLAEHMSLAQIVEKLGDKRFFHQGKVHEAPEADVCHQSFFRPYLSEEPFPGSKEPGSVFPCDSVVLNQDAEHFSGKFAVCRPGEILDYMDHKLKANFTPHKDCTGCVFTNTVNMLERFKNGGEDHFAESVGVELKHAHFV